MQKTTYNPWGTIETYYRFKVEANLEDGTFELIRMIHKGASSLFDKIYYEGDIFEYNSPQSEGTHDKFGQVHIKFRIEDDSPQGSSVQVIWGSRGSANIIKNTQGLYNVIYRQPEPNEYELFFINRRPGSSIDYLSKLKQGKLDNKIQKLLGS
jgi:hypothetical protein